MKTKPNDLPPRSPTPKKKLKLRKTPNKVSETLSIAGSAASTKSNKSFKLPFLKQIAKDIEKAGGIVNCSLAKDVFNNPDNFGRYGVPGSDIRKRVSKKVSQWRELHSEGRYTEEVLNRFGVKSYSVSKKFASASDASSIDGYLSSSSDDDSLSSKSDLEKQPKKTPSRAPPLTEIQTVAPGIVTMTEPNQSPIRPRTPSSMPAPPGVSKCYIVE